MKLNFCFPKKFHLCKLNEIDRVFKFGKKISAYPLFCYVVKTDLSYCRLGICINKRYGKACQRNYFKRLIRESFRTLPMRFQWSLDIIILPMRGASKKISLNMVQQSWGKIFQEIQIFFHPIETSQAQQKLSVNSINIIQAQQKLSVNHAETSQTHPKLEETK
ncbi:MAG: ribonuclease P protein component [Planctomycetes bacterium]|jgi:ribonuclease P protein component|nr:ribonuclease P protein component [Planctomycetota bacterium]HON45968.1 ribonuclease P protein component [Planctomycetota bacterium]HPY74378.1 ribonuclease P protein component [Planctomycetota bacterium]HQA99962.1 ribonuclease P protein component [Planctomycetota bacterium]HRU50869.1 ribonuclease P protein component [Planctomycetota bacterium]